MSDFHCKQMIKNGTKLTDMIKIIFLICISQRWKIYFVMTKCRWFIIS